MVKDHSEVRKENPLPPHGLLFQISSKESFVCTIPQTGFVTPVVEHWLEQEVAQGSQLEDQSSDFLNVSLKKKKYLKKGRIIDSGCVGLTRIFKREIACWVSNKRYIVLKFRI